MRFRRKIVITFSILLGIAFIIEYFLGMKPMSFYKNMENFLLKATHPLSYYGTHTFVFIIIPIFLFYLTALSTFEPQVVLRIGSKKRNCLAKLNLNMILVVIFIIVNFFIGFIYPMVFRVDILHNQFWRMYLWQCVLWGVYLIIIGNIVLFLRVFIRNKLVGLGIVYFGTLINFIFRNYFYCVIVDFDILNSHFALGHSVHPFKLLMYLLGMFIFTFAINLFVCSEEEYYEI